jgi:molybdopterin converting factor small subunit
VNRQDEHDRPTTIELRLFAGLQHFNPPSPEAYPIGKGTTVRTVLKALGIPEEKARLLFVNGIKAGLDSVLQGGERVGIFPPVGGG